MISKKASRYATKLTLRDTDAKTVGEARDDYNKLIEDKPHQFGIIDKITTLEEANQRGNYFSEVDGHYPRGMSVCEIVGISGDCGFDCPDFTAGTCEQGASMLEAFLKTRETSIPMDDEELNPLLDLYETQRLTMRDNKKEMR